MAIHRGETGEGFGLAWVREGGRRGENEEREINKTEENRSINISAAASFTDFLSEP